MTKHYSAHANLEAKREKMKQLPAFMMLTVATEQQKQSVNKEKILQQISDLPEDKLAIVADFLTTL